MYTLVCTAFLELDLFTDLFYSHSTQRLIAPSGEKDVRDGPSVWISKRSDSVSVCKVVLLSVLIIFIEENILSTCPLEKGKLKASWLSARILILAIFLHLERC